MDNGLSGLIVTSTKTQIESLPLLSTPCTSGPVNPSTLIRYLDGDWSRVTRETRTARSLLLYTRSDLVADPSSVNTVSKRSVSVENASCAEPEVSKLSLKHEVNMKTQATTRPMTALTYGEMRTGMNRSCFTRGKNMNTCQNSGKVECNQGSLDFNLSHSHTRIAPIFSHKKQSGRRLSPAAFIFLLQLL